MSGGRMITALLVLGGFWMGLQVGSHYTPSPVFLADVMFMVMLAAVLFGNVIGFGFLAINLWEKRKQKQKATGGG